jgi:hypothetical protein
VGLEGLGHGGAEEGAAIEQLAGGGGCGQAESPGQGQPGWRDPQAGHPHRSHRAFAMHRLEGGARSAHPAADDCGVRWKPPWRKPMGSTLGPGACGSVGVLYQHEPLSAGSGKEALIHLGRYFYRGVLPEQNSLSDRDRLVTFRIKTNTGEEVIQTLPGGEFLWLLIQHVLPRRFGGVRDDGHLHHPPAEPRARPPVCCPHRGEPMRILAVRVKQLRPSSAEADHSRRRLMKEDSLSPCCLSILKPREEPAILCLLS